MKLLSLKNLSIIAAIALYSCGGNAENKTTDQSDSTEVAASEAEKDEETSKTVNTSSGKKYEIKSGVVKYKMSIMGMDTDVEIYFDDYGAKEANLASATMEMMGMSIETKTRTVTKDGWQYTIDEKEQTGTKMEMKDEFSMQNFDPSKLQGEMKKAYETALENATSDNFLGKDCKVIDLKDTQNNNSSKIWLWKNIPLKYSATNEQGTFEMAAVAVEEKDVDAALFDIPSNIEFKEVSPEMLQEQLEKMGGQ